MSAATYYARVQDAENVLDIARWLKNAVTLNDPDEIQREIARLEKALEAVK